MKKLTRLAYDACGFGLTLATVLWSAASSNLHAASPGPSLTISPRGTGVDVIMDATAKGYRLESTRALTPNANWTAVDGKRLQGAFTNFVAMDIAGFYRLTLSQRVNVPEPQFNA